MRVLFDTSVLVPVLAAALPRHDEAFEVFRRVLSGEVQMLVTTHALAELYSTLTVLPITPRISPSQANAMIREGVSARADVVALAEEEYVSVLSRMANQNLAGGIVYDALHVEAARRAKVERLWTYNTKDFERVWPKHGGLIEEP